MPTSDISHRLRAQLSGAVLHRAAGVETSELLNVVGKNAANAAISVVQQAGETVVACIQLQDAHGNDVSRVSAVTVLLFDTADGTTFNTDDYKITSDKHGSVAEVVPGKMLVCMCNATGAIDIALASNKTATSYLGVVLPGGKLAISDPVSHTAPKSKKKSTQFSSGEPASLAKKKTRSSTGLLANDK
jgi:hypothetical protein